VDIRFIHNYFHPDVSSVSQVITEIARDLSAHGCDVSVIASRNWYTGGRPERLVAREEIDGIRVRRIWGPSLGKRDGVGVPARRFVVRSVHAVAHSADSPRG
jgi:hypothetical protein